MPKFDTVIAGGMVVDGLRHQRRRADVGIAGGRIAEIGRIPRADARRVLDAEGFIVAPGHIDLHTHYDAQLFWDPYCTLSGWHGVTSVVIGNCGFGFAPVRPDEQDAAMRTMTRVEAIPYDAMRAGMPWGWTSYPEFLDAVERTAKSLNIRAFMPVQPLLVWVLGRERAKAAARPTELEHAEMRRLLHEAMDAGAGGWSVQRLRPDGGFSVQRDHDGSPMATDVMHNETLFALCEVLAERNDGFIQATLAPSAGDPAEVVTTFERLAEVSGRPVLFNVILPDDKNPDQHRGLIAWLDDCRRRGLSIYGQALTTDAGFTFSLDEWNLFDELDAWREATTGSREERLAKLADPRRRAALRSEEPRITTCPFAEIVVAETGLPENRRWENHTLGDVAEALGTHPVDAMLDMAVAENLDTVFFGRGTNSELRNLRELLAYEWAIPGVSDGGAHTKFLTAGRFPTELLIRAVRDNDIVSLEEAHWRLAALPAHCAGFTDRGTLTPGAAADVIVYDLDGLAVTPTEKVYDFPGGEWRRVQRARGYAWVLVNGEVTIDHDEPTGAPAGRLLRNRRAGA